MRPSLNLAIRGSEGFGKSQTQKTPLESRVVWCYSYTRKNNRMGISSLILSLFAMAFCYAAQLSIRPSKSMISWAAARASLT